MTNKPQNQINLLESGIRKDVGGFHCLRKLQGVDVLLGYGL